MKGKKVFTSEEARIIIDLIRQKLTSGKYEQQKCRRKIRRIGFYASDFGLRGGYDEYDFKRCITIIDDEQIENASIIQSHGTPPIISQKRSNSDESYIIDLCDEALGLVASRQHKFVFLTGDAGTKLPVDAYYKELALVIEYRERQHTEEVKFFDRRNTVSGVSRGEQRRIYDQRRRDVLPVHDITLIELNYSDFEYTSSKKLLRRRKEDLEVIRHKLGVD